MIRILVLFSCFIFHSFSIAQVTNNFTDKEKVSADNCSYKLGLIDLLGYAQLKQDYALIVGEVFSSPCENEYTNNQLLLKVVGSILTSEKNKHTQSSSQISASRKLDLALSAYFIKGETPSQEMVSNGKLSLMQSEILAKGLSAEDLEALKAAIDHLN